MDTTLRKISDEYTGFTNSLRARKLSPMTINSYQKVLHLFVDRTGDPTTQSVTRRQIQTFLADVGENRAAATVAAYHCGLRAFFRWIADEDDFPDPTIGLKQPRVRITETEVLSHENLAKLLAVYDVKRGTFYQRRNNAILWLMATSGMRLSEVTNIEIKQLDLDADPPGITNVLGKGRKIRRANMHAKAAARIGSYTRFRDQHPLATSTTRLWLGHMGPITPAGVWRVVHNAGVKAKVPLHPHTLRHTYASIFLELGGSEIDLLTQCGWEHTEMLKRYGVANAERRAMTSHAKFNPGSFL